MKRTAVESAGSRLLLDNVDWRTYSRLLRTFAERPSIRLTYDRGRLEIMSPLTGHEGNARLLERFVTILTEELGLPLAPGGSTTFRRRDKRRGLEPDNCYWIANEARVRGKERINLAKDPPPDLAHEIDATKSSLNRMAIYAALKVPEVWRWRKHVLTFHILDAQGKYQVSETSLAFPGLTPSDLQTFLALIGQMDHNAIGRKFREWVKLRSAEQWNANDSK